MEKTLRWGSSMFTQIFRNRISQSTQLKNRIGRLDSVIRSNLNKKERIIVQKLTKEWNKGGRIYLKPFSLGGNSYNLWIDFCQWKTHGLSVNVEDIVDPDSCRLEFKTEYGDIAIVVDYIFQSTYVNRKVSLLQTKKEKRQGQVDVKLHQLYLMQNWPCIEFPTGIRYQFRGVYPDQFSFYHFILNYSANKQFCSSLCSSPFVGHLLGSSKAYLQKKLKTWLSKRKSSPKKLAPPSKPLYANLLPGAIYNASKSYNWQLVPKSFDRFLLDAAYLFVGTNHKDVLALTKARVSTILAMKVVGSRHQEENVDRHNDMKNNSA